MMIEKSRNSNVVDLAKLYQALSLDQRDLARQLFLQKARTTCSTTISSITERTTGMIACDSNTILTSH